MLPWPLPIGVCFNANQALNYINPVTFSAITLHEGRPVTGMACCWK